MKTTDNQIELLKFYAKYETRPMTIVSIALKFWLNWLLLLIAVVIGLWNIDGGWPAPGWLLIGICIGIFSRDVHRIVSLYRTWIVIREVTKWERLKELIQNHNDDVV